MEFSISLTDQELQIALECLSKQAYCVVAPVINKINQQIAEQATAPQAPVSAPAVAPPEGSG